MQEASISDDSDDEVRMTYENHHFSLPIVETYAEGYHHSDMSTNNRLPLIPSDYGTVEEASENFLRVFEARYGDKHPFFTPISLTDAIQDLQSAHFSVRKPILLYLHDDNSVTSQLFCTQVLCTSTIIDFINSNFLFWAWDFTLAENRTKVIEWLETMLGHRCSLKIRVCTHDDFPVMAVIGKAPGGIDLITVIKNTHLVEEVMVQLISALDVCQEQNQVEAAEEAERMKREKMRSEQEAEFLASLEADMMKSKRKQLEEKQKELEKQEEVAKELEKEEERKRIENRLHPEPTTNCAQSTTTIRIRLPNGQNLERRFLMSAPLSQLLDFVASKGYSINDYKLLTSFPKRDLTSMDSKKTFGDLSFNAREAIVIEAR